MEYRALGRSGLQVSPLCLGTMNFGDRTSEADSIAIIGSALEAGINFVDTSNSYTRGESERIVGQAFRELGCRDEVILATKLYNVAEDGINNRDLSRYNVIRSCEASLKRLGVETIDLLQLHRPSARGVPQDETLRALDDLVTAGKVRYIGSSTFAAWMIMEGLALSERYGWVSYTSEQPPYNLLDRRIENEIVPLAEKYGLGLMPWSPLGMGVLAGIYPPGEAAPAESRLGRGRAYMSIRATPTAREVGAKLVEMAAERGLTAARLALLWCKDQPGVTSPVIGPRTMAHLEDALPVLEMSLADEDRPWFDELVHPGNAVADFYNTAWWMKARVLP